MCSFFLTADPHFLDPVLHQEQNWNDCYSIFAVSLHRSGVCREQIRWESGAKNEHLRLEYWSLLSRSIILGFS